MTLTQDELANLSLVEGLLYLDASDEEDTILIELGAMQNAGIDWTTGDILEATKDKDGKYIVQKDKDGKDVKDANGNPVYAEYKIKYHYDKEFDRYFEIKTKADVNGEEKVIGISILDENDVAELKKAIDKACEETVTVGQRYVSANIGGIYATLNAYAVSSEKANYATYEAYDYAKISEKADGS